MSDKVEELVKRYLERKRQNSINKKGIAQTIRNLILEKLKKKGDYVELREIVQELINTGKAQEWFGEDVQYNMVYNRVRQAVANKKDFPVKFGATEDGVVVLVRVQ